MKRLVFIVSFSVSSLLIYNITRCLNNNFPIVQLENIEELAYGEELPGIEIICGSPENKGRCWDGECKTIWTPLGFYKGWVCDKATGDVNTVCINDVPC